MKKYRIAGGLLLVLAIAGCPSNNDQGPGAIAWLVSNGGITYLNAVTQTADGGFVAAGYQKASTQVDGDALLVRVSPEGVAEWSRLFGGTSDDELHAIAQLEDGGFILAGTTYSLGDAAGDIYVIRTSADGSQVWAGTYGEEDALDAAADVITTADGGFLIAGETARTENSQALLMKLDTDGKEKWTKLFGGPLTDTAAAVARVSGGGYVAVGHTQVAETPVEENIYYIRTDASGNAVRILSLNNKQYDRGFDVVQTADGGFAIAALTGDACTDSGAATSTMLLKLDSQGNVDWNEIFYRGSCGISWSEPRALVNAPDGGLVLAGTYRSLLTTGGNDMYILKADSEGTQVWYRSFTGTRAYDWASDIAVTSDGGYIVSGVTGKFAGGLTTKDQFDGALVQLDAEGNRIPPEEVPEK